jgi:hypothetical protein
MRMYGPEKRGSLPGVQESQEFIELAYRKKITSFILIFIVNLRRK